MKLSKEELEEVSSRLSNLATYCDFTRQESNICQFVIGSYCDNDLDSAIYHLKRVMYYYEPLMERLNLVRAALDGLLIKEKTLAG